MASEMPRSDEISILLSEKQHADRAIGDYLELQLKIFALLSGAGGAALGLFFTRSADQQTSSIGYAAVLSAIGGCLVVLQSIATYGIAVAYIHYKQVAIMPRLRELSGMGADTINTENEFRQGPASLPVSFATAVLAFVHLAGTLFLLIFAKSHISPSAAKTWTLTLAALLLLTTCAAEGLLLSAMNKAGRR
jgi:hypothetical protein